MYESNRLGSMFFRLQSNHVMSAQDYVQISTGIKSTITGCINWRDRAEVDFWMQHKTMEGRSS